MILTQHPDFEDQVTDLKKKNDSFIIAQYSSLQRNVLPLTQGPAIISEITFCSA